MLKTIVLLNMFANIVNGKLLYASLVFGELHKRDLLQPELALPCH